MLPQLICRRAVSERTRAESEARDAAAAAVWRRVLRKFGEWGSWGSRRAVADEYAASFYFFNASVRADGGRPGPAPISTRQGTFPTRSSPFGARRRRAPGTLPKIDCPK